MNFLFIVSLMKMSNDDKMLLTHNSSSIEAAQNCYVSSFIGEWTMHTPKIEVEAWLIETMLKRGQSMGYV